MTTWFYMADIRGAIARYQHTHNRLPTKLTDLCDKDGRCTFTISGKKPADAWGRPITYSDSANEFELRSAGPDGIPNTADDLIFSTNANRRAADHAAGCYTVELTWPDGSSLKFLHLYADSLGIAKYKLDPELGDRDAWWTPLWTDDVWIRWSGVAWKQLRLKWEGGELKGLASSGGDESRGAVQAVTLRRVACHG